MSTFLPLRGAIGLGLENQQERLGKLTIYSSASEPAEYFRDEL